jgi:hypothetical protein
MLTWVKEWGDWNRKQWLEDFIQAWLLTFYTHTCNTNEGHDFLKTEVIYGSGLKGIIIFTQFDKKRKMKENHKRVCDYPDCDSIHRG